ncbi:M64 family metallopeptidase [Mariniflexile ostreae]|uniref:M64 family metallopeptidase n=1 Tax=Mariniflexile ostreae TaxID=1520892 RepID=A0ABV5FCZ4_9FLAO
MKQTLLFFLIIMNSSFVFGQQFEMEFLKNSGAPNKRINLVILSEGYQTHEFPKFITDATTLTNKMFGYSPFSEYVNYFNVVAIKVPSNESGADHPGTSTDPLESTITPVVPIKTVDTYFNATYDAFGFHRLLFYESDGAYANHTELKIAQVLAQNFPNYDSAIILVNSNEYGGSGGKYPMAYSGYYATDVVVHELGHSLFNLIDEYYPIDDALAVEGINMTQETDPNVVKWRNWLNFNDVGVYQHFDANNLPKPWYRPHQNCKMRSIEKAFCPVCKEGIIEKIHDLVSPIESYLPNNTTIDAPTFPLNFKLNLIQTTTNSLKNKWFFNGLELTHVADAISLLETDLEAGSNTLTAVIDDTTALLRVDHHETLHLYTVTWTIHYATLAVDRITSEDDTFNISIFPNPSSGVINFKYQNTTNTPLYLDIISMDGKKIESQIALNSNASQIDMSLWSPGIYIVNFYANHVLIASKKLIKN